MKTQAQKLNAIKMSEQPTPETDAEWDKYIRHPYTHGAGDLRILLQRLERERDEAREKLRMTNIESNARQEIASALKERDEAREAWYVMQSSFERSRDEVEKLIRERDDARDVLEGISLYLSSGIGDENTTAQQYKERILDGVKHLAGHAWEERCKFERERDEAREKYDLEAVENMLAVNKICHERDEARGELARIESLLLDPHAVFLNFLRGKIAKLDWANLEHIHGPHPARVERDEAREALMKIEEVFIESDDTYEDLIKMGNIARAVLEAAK